MPSSKTVATRPAVRTAKSTPAADAHRPPAELIDRRIAELGDWRGDTLSRLRALIRSADPGVVEEWKWNVPVWSSQGIVCTGETYQKAVKLTFAHGAALPDPARLFNASLEGQTRRAIDVREGALPDADALVQLVRAAVSRNAAAAAAKATNATKAPAAPSPKAGRAGARR